MALCLNVKMQDGFTIELPDGRLILLSIDKANNANSNSRRVVIKADKDIHIKRKTREELHDLGLHITEDD